MPSGYITEAPETLLKIKQNIAPEEISAMMASTLPGDAERRRVHRVVEPGLCSHTSRRRFLARSAGTSEENTLTLSTPGPTFRGRRKGTMIATCPCALSAKINAVHLNKHEGATTTAITFLDEEVNDHTTIHRRTSTWYTDTPYLIVRLGSPL